MSEICNIPHPLKRDGTTQHERFPEALGDDYIKVDEQDVPQLVRLSHAYAKYVYFFPSDGSATINWQPFFEEIKQIAEDKNNYVGDTFVFEKLETISETKPHIALFFAFLRLFGFAQDSINQLGGKHLDFYYKEILQLKEKPAQPDKVALFFELEKNILNKKIAAGILFKAGKDDTGKELYYKLTDEALVNAALVSNVKTVFVQKNKTANTLSITADQNELNNSNAWVTFGEASNAAADIGFMLSSPAFYLLEGTRTITISISGLPKLADNALQVAYTAKDKWATDCTIITWPGSITITLAEQSPSVVNYDNEIHAGAYQSKDPIIKIKLKAAGNNNYAYDFLKNINLASSNFKVNIDVTNVRNLLVESDNGTVETAKPFYPFGITPTLGSGFYVGYPLAFNKYLQSFSLNYTLLQPNTQDVITSFAKLNNLNFTAQEMLLGKPTVSKISYNNLKANKILEKTFVSAIERVNSHVGSYYFADVLVLNNKKWNPLTYAYRDGVSIKQNLQKFTNDIDNTITALLPDTEGGFIKLSLSDIDLDYEKYIREFTAAVIANDPQKNIPKKPLEPKLSDVSLDYTLQLSLSDMVYFHIHPFGFEAVQDNTQSITPTFNEDGNLYIGISNFENVGLLNLYFQIQEDSGDVNKTIQPITWYSLKGNVWHGLAVQQILKDSTHNLTQSGILSFNVLPSSADVQHSIMEDGLVWLKASVTFDSEAYPKMIGIKAQAAIAIFDDHENDPKHLSTPLAKESISKFFEKPDGVKAVTQPFESYDGKMKEEKKHFYTRISERLRHKQRVWNIWDYERMILENFPFIYKAKCISHTTEQTEYAPGHTTIIVIPNLVNTATYNKLEPRVSVGNLQKINDFIHKYKSPFAKIKVINPVYEKIRIEADVVLHPQYNDQYYANELQSMITTYLAPWINNDPVKLSFNGTIHRSSIINLLDESEYVDYVSKFKMIKLKSSEDDMAAGIHEDEFNSILESSILTSAGVHIININKPC
jgi:Baseplate J-like protein